MDTIFLEQLGLRACQSGEALVRVAGQIQCGPMLQGTRQGKPFTYRAIVPFLQAINHATEHRAHVVTILSQHGVEPPALDLRAYGREYGLKETGSQ